MDSYIWIWWNLSITYPIHIILSVNYNPMIDLRPRTTWKHIEATQQQWDSYKLECDTQLQSVDTSHGIHHRKSTICLIYYKTNHYLAPLDYPMPNISLNNYGLKSKNVSIFLLTNTFTKK